MNIYEMSYWVQRSGYRDKLLGYMIVFADTPEEAISEAQKWAKENGYESGGEWIVDLSLGEVKRGVIDSLSDREY